MAVRVKAFERHVGCFIVPFHEGVWREHENGLGNLAARNADQLAAIVKNRLKKIQYRPALIDGFLAQTGLTVEPQPP